MFPFLHIDLQDKSSRQCLHEGAPHPRWSSCSIRMNGYSTSYLFLHIQYHSSRGEPCHDISLDVTHVATPLNSDQHCI